ncbi:hypothetical protein GJ496_010767 [Pomphorhynchus laevis]|nr:hypothetical protein GJ496_010767 [Pomphorhynchus laevis]
MISALDSNQIEFAFSLKEVRNTVSTNLFTVFSPQSRVHSDKSSEFFKFLKADNSQLERYNGLIWRKVQLRLHETNKATDRYKQTETTYIKQIVLITSIT